MYLNRSELSQRLKVCNHTSVAYLIRLGVIPAPAHEVGGRRGKFYRQDEVAGLVGMVRAWREGRRKWRSLEAVSDMVGVWRYTILRHVELGLIPGPVRRGGVSHYNPDQIPAVRKHFARIARLYTLTRAARELGAEPRLLWNNIGKLPVRLEIAGEKYWRKRDLRKIRKALGLDACGARA